VHVESSGITTRQFLLELWLEPRDPPSTTWLLRGRIRDLATSEGRGIGSLADLGRFIDAVLTAAGAPAHQWQAAP
jgi:hypothetical protein